MPRSGGFRRASRRYVTTLVVADVCIGFLAAAGPAAFSDTISRRSGMLLLGLGLLGAVVWPLAIGLLRGYQRNQIGVGSDELRAAMRAGVAVVFAGAFPAGFLNDVVLQHALMKLVVLGTPIAVSASLVVRYCARKRLHSRQGRGEAVRRVVVVGGSAGALQLREQLAREPYCGMSVVGICVPRTDLLTAAQAGVPVLGDLSQVAEVVRQYAIDGVAVSSDDATRNNYLRELSWSLEGLGVEVMVDPGLVEVAGPRMHIRPLMGFPLLHVEEPHFTGWRRIVKRTSDLAMTTCGLIVIAPVLAVIALAIKLQDGGPVLFKQARVGRDGRAFTMYKFRSMVIDAEARKADLECHNEADGALFKMAHDPRITRLGGFLRKYSLDELPQLFNVLNGTMSLVGPRPHLAAELAAMPQHSSRRALVTPGLTGLWQVSGRSNLDGDEGLRLDLRYVENWSLALDLLILWKTASAVLAKQGAY